MKLTRILAATLTTLMLGMISGCGSVNPEIYAKQQPSLDLRRYFDGTIDAWGIFQDRSGEVLQRFTVTIEARWQGQVGTLDETFVYSDGRREKRVWTLREVAPGRYVGTAGDVIGEAQGHAAGNALNWRYTLALPVNGSIYHVQFDDWMFQVDDQVMLNRAVMSKFGFRLGEVLLSFKRRQAS